MLVLVSSKLQDTGSGCKRLGKYYDKQGNSLSLAEFATMFEQDRIVKQEQVGVYWISTVLLGIDHSFSGGGPPLIFETMVFRGSASDLDMDRYSTEEQALQGHDAMVRKWRKRQPNIFERFWLYLKDIDKNLQREKWRRYARKRYQP